MANFLAISNGAKTYQAVLKDYAPESLTRFDAYAFSQLLESEFNEGDDELIPKLIDHVVEHGLDLFCDHS